MSAEALHDDEEQYDSSQDSDFAPDAAAEPTSDHSDSEDDEAQNARKRQRDGDAEAEDAGYNNSGDEAIIERGNKRQRKSKKAPSDALDEEGGEGGLIKTRRQRAAEKEERKYAAINGPVTVDVDAIWSQMLAGKPTASHQSPATEPAELGTQTNGAQEQNTKSGSSSAELPSGADESNMIRIKRTYNFAGRVHTEEKLVPRDSAEAKLFLASQGQAAADTAAADALPTKRTTKKAFRSAFEPITDPLPQRADLNLGVAARIQAGREAQAKKLNTVEKSRMDWAGFVDKEGIKDELELAGKSKESYANRQDFLARSEARREDEARRARLSGRV
ncbi:SWR1-complex protein 5 [Paramyrothecium foliicola]|nr:SWR1-complex protein 5 [Paramyrothecium foliicola]